MAPALGNNFGARHAMHVAEETITKNMIGCEINTDTRDNNNYLKYSLKAKMILTSHSRQLSFQTKDLT